MKPGSASPRDPRPREAAIEDEAGATGLPGAPRWRTVYLFVLGIFLLWVGLLAGLTRWGS